MTWIGLLANVAVLPFIGLVAFSGPPWQAVNLSLAFSLAWPAAIVGIVASAGLLAERIWGVILAMVSLAMVISGTLPYGIVRLVVLGKSFSPQGDPYYLGVLCLVISALNILALIYWCRPIHRKGLRL